MLNATIEASALVLAELKIGNNVVAQPTAEAGEDAEPVERLPRTREEYARIWETNIFKLWQEPPPPPPPDVVAAEAPTPQPEPEPQYQEPPPPARPNKRIGATISMSGKLAVLILDCDDPGKPCEKVEINQPVDDGTLVLVLPGGNGGMVVQVPEQSGLALLLPVWPRRNGPAVHFRRSPRNRSAPGCRDSGRAEQGPAWLIRTKCMKRAPAAPGRGPAGLRRRPARRV